MNRTKLKEAYYLMTQGRDADENTIDQILGKLLPKGKPSVRVVINFVAGHLKLLTQEFGSFELMPTATAFRGQNPNDGNFLWQPESAESQVQFRFLPDPDKEQIFLSIEPQTKAKLSAELWLDGGPVETLKSLAKESMFDSPISLEASPEVVVFDAGSEIGRYHFLLQA
ncbi:hypothetical protein P3G55_04905 [Leptospira sp. 96542]|nr:hypothetical protein [Leptospira sp. 96542]